MLDKVRINIHVDENLRQRFKLACVKKDATITEVLIECMEEYIKKVEGDKNEKNN